MTPITLIYAAILTLLFLVLSVRVITYRRSEQIGLGDGGDKGLIKRMRAHANFIEYTALGLMLMALLELNGLAALFLHVLGGLLLAGRFAHAYGFSTRPPVMPLRVAGMVLTLTALGLSAIAAVILTII